MRPPETQLPDGDPQLKAALRRVFGSEVAPASLRKRVAQLAGSQADPKLPSKKPTTGTLIKLGIAAMLLGYAAWQFTTYIQEEGFSPFPRHTSPTTQSAGGAGCGSSACTQSK